MSDTNFPGDVYDVRGCSNIPPASPGFSPRATNVELLTEPYCVLFDQLDESNRSDTTPLGVACL